MPEHRLDALPLSAESMPHFRAGHNPYTPDSVAKATESMSADDTLQHPTKEAHYTQPLLDWEGTYKGELEQFLEQLNIDVSEQTILIIGGYTGEFAEALRDLGADIIFTDPMTSWVENAREKGMEAIECAAHAIPNEAIERATLAIDFECYHALSSRNSAIYTYYRLCGGLENGVVHMWSGKTTSDLSTATDMNASEDGRIPVDDAFAGVSFPFNGNIDFETTGKLAGNYLHFGSKRTRNEIKKTVNVISKLKETANEGRILKISSDGIEALSSKLDMDELEVQTAIAKYRVSDEMFRMMSDMCGGPDKFTAGAKFFEVGKYKIGFDNPESWRRLVMDEFMVSAENYDPDGDVNHAGMQSPM